MERVSMSAAMGVTTPGFCRPGGRGRIAIRAAWASVWCSAVVSATPLNDALDAPDPAFSVTGNSSVEWAVDILETHDGIDSVRSPLVNPPTAGSQQYFGIVTELTGPAEVSFWWKRQGGGTLRLFVDHSWSGSLPTGGESWARASASIGPGTHRLEWRLDVPSSPPTPGQFWLDAVDVARPPIAITNTKPAEGEVGQPFELQIATTAAADAFGASPLPDGLVVNTTTGRITGTPTTAGLTTSRLTATSGGFTAEAMVQIRIFDPQTSLAQALDGDGFHWTTSDSTAWRGRVTPSGQDAAFPDQAKQVVFPEVPDAESYQLQTTITGPDVVTFWWKPVGDGFNDSLQLTLDGTVITPRTIPGLPRTAWKDEKIDIPPGLHQLRWTQSGATWSGSGLDQVARATGSSLCLTGPRRVWLPVGAPAFLPITANKQDFQIAVDGLPPGLTHGGTTPVLRGTPTQPGDYLATVTATSPHGQARMLLALTITEFSPALALAQPNRSWHQSGDGWQPSGPGTLSCFPVTDTTGLGTGVVPSSLETTVVGPDRVTFDWDCSRSFILGGQYAIWQLSIDDQVVRSRFEDTGEGGIIPGTLGWKSEIVPIPPGIHRLRWTFTGTRPQVCCLGSSLGLLRAVSFDSDHDTYTAWITRCGVPADQSDPSQDPDGDTRNNWTEYAFLGHPLTADGPLTPTSFRLGTEIYFDFPIRAGDPIDLEYTVEQLDVQQWRPEQPDHWILTAPDTLTVTSGPITAAPQTSLKRLTASRRP